MTTFWLSTHLAYACRHSGACCTAGWPIPIERDRAEDVAAAIAAGQVEVPAVWYRPDREAPEGIAGVLSRTADDACVFYRHPHPPAAPGDARSGRCTIHRWRPVSCRHFPYVCVIDQRGVHVTLSHYCPTVADLLFDGDAEVSIVEGPPVPLDGIEVEGLDARESLPPIAPGSRPKAPGDRPQQLMSWDEVTRWEQASVARLMAESAVPAVPDPAAFDCARAAAPGWSWPEAPADLATVWETLVAPEWARWSRAIGRYLAARAHASWAMYLGAGPADVERMVTRARTVVQVEAVRACLERRTRLDRPALTEAVRRSDLLLVHYTDPFRLDPALDARIDDNE